MFPRSEVLAPVVSLAGTLDGPGQPSCMAPTTTE